jgi:glycosyltransferase involved in cell wall biosynthesis
MRKIRVLHLTSTRYGIGGVEKLLLDMSDKYDAEKFEVSYCNLFCDAGGKGVFPTALRERGLNVFEVKGRSWGNVPGMVLKLGRLLRRERIDILHLHMMQATIVGGLAAKVASRPKVVVTKHYTDELSNQSAIIKGFDNHFTQTADSVVAISNYVKSDMMKLSVPGVKITVIHNGTDIKEFDRRAEGTQGPDLNAGGGPPLIGTVGSLTERKGHRYFFEAIPEIIRKKPDVHFIVIGEGPQKQQLEHLRISLGLEDRLTMLGFQENVVPLLKQMDLYVHPSVHEPFGIAILEAMAAGRPVVASSVEGIPEIVIDGETGYLVEPGNAMQLSRAICDLLEDKDKIERMGRAGRYRVENLFPIERTVREYERLYDAIYYN